VAEGTPITVLILDNLTVAMTGGQDSNATNRLAAICHGLGISPEHTQTIVPLPVEHEKNVAILAKEIAYDGPSVIIAERECVQTARKHAKQSATEEGTR